MKYTVKEKNNAKIAFVYCDGPRMSNADSTLDFVVYIRSETGCDRIAINKEAFPEAFFDLKTGLAGETLQKIVNYHFKLAIIGDFSGYTSKALRDFIRESNRGKDIFFVGDEAEALDKLSAAAK
ncbi:MAG: DUF4180 domain-containing protein [Oscillospiraceae bacterium]|nr:DUF4180 domain-containing protein [Oscillospiraceae bacterium]